MSCGADLVANALATSLLQGKDFTLPEIDFSGDDFQIPDTTGNPLFQDLKGLSLEDLTTRQVGGAGVFDGLMESIKNHLKEEYSANRITGAEYSKVYIAMVQGAMATSVQFLLGKDQAYWQAALIQAQAKQAEVALIQARVELIAAKLMTYMRQYEALTAEATYALTKLKIATEDQQYCQLKAQTDVLIEQKALIQEQTEVQRSQTLDTRRDGDAVVGSVGKQKDLLTQQITSYQRDAEVKAAKMFVDAWITQKTIDEGLLAPNGFTNASLDTVLTKLKLNNGLT
jgi:hypothetical protein